MIDTTCPNVGSSGPTEVNVTMPPVDTDTSLQHRHGGRILLRIGSFKCCVLSCQRPRSSCKLSSGRDNVQLSFVVERQCQTAVAIAVNPKLVPSCHEDHEVNIF